MVTNGFEQRELDAIFQRTPYELAISQQSSVMQRDNDSHHVCFQLTEWLVMNTCVNELGHLWFR